MREVAFIKMHGIGNDYVFIDCFPSETAGVIAETDLSELARRVSDRHYGIGSDGLVLILPDPEADARMRMFNADGSEAQMCGNAIRCIGKYLYESGLCRKEALRVATKAGIRELEIHVANGIVESVTVNMGKPIVMQDKLDLDGETLEFMSVNMGNPHAVFFRDRLPSSDEVAVLGERIGTHPHFPEGTNVEFARVRNNKVIDLRVWERGTGETMACGTGACATAVAAMCQGLTQREVTIHLRGGDLLITWQTDNEPVYMTGSATEVFRGKVRV
jgi:diaminopimelate epimerase